MSKHGKGSEAMFNSKSSWLSFENRWQNESVCTFSWPSRFRSLVCMRLILLKWPSMGSLTLTCSHGLVSLFEKIMVFHNYGVPSKIMVFSIKFSKIVKKDIKVIENGPKHSSKAKPLSFDANQNDQTLNNLMCLHDKCYPELDNGACSSSKILENLGKV